MCVFLWQMDFPYLRNLIGVWNTVTWTNETTIVLCVSSSRDERPGGGNRVGLGVQPVLGKPSDASNG
jgi:hypothetical protein